MYGPGHISYFDYLVLGIILISVIQAAITGFIRELLSLVGLIVAFIVASMFGDRLTPYLIGAIPIERVASAVSYLLVFCGVSLILGMLVKIISFLARKAIDAGINHTLGALFGFLRAFIVLVVPFYYATLYIKEDMFGTWLTKSISYPFLHHSAEILRKLMPDSMQPEEKEPVINEKTMDSLKKSVEPLKETFENGGKPISLIPQN